MKLVSRCALTTSLSHSVLHREAAARRGRHDRLRRFQVIRLPAAYACGTVDDRGGGRGGIPQKFLDEARELPEPGRRLRV